MPTRYVFALALFNYGWAYVEAAAGSYILALLNGAMGIILFYLLKDN